MFPVGSYCCNRTVVSASFVCGPTRLVSYSFSFQPYRKEQDCPCSPRLELERTTVTVETSDKICHLPEGRPLSRSFRRPKEKSTVNRTR